MAKQSFPGKRLNGFLMDPNDIVIIGLDTDDGIEHPLYDERIHFELDENLVRNIHMMGVLEPILVRKNGEFAEVIDGRQRVRCAREAARRQIKAGEEPVRVKVFREYGEDSRLFGISISTNEHRKSDTPLNRARKLQRYLAMGRTIDEAAVMFGVTIITIRNWRNLLELSNELKEEVDAGTISASAAVKLSDLSRDEQNTAIAEIKASGTPVTNASVGRKARTKRTSTGQVQRPGVSLIRRVLTVEDKEWTKNTEGVDIPEVVLETLKWVAGKSDGSNVPGLAKVLEIIAKAESDKLSGDTKKEDAKSNNSDDVTVTPIGSTNGVPTGI